MTNLHIVPELWADVKNYEGLYQVSISGRVKSMPKIRKSRGLVYFHPAKILSQSKTNNGYYAVSLWKEGIKKSMGVHRIIAETFIANPNNSSQVNHKNGVKSDNRIENLEWVSQSENAIHAIKMRKNN